MDEPIEKIPSDENSEGDPDESDGESISDILEFEEEQDDIEEAEVEETAEDEDENEEDSENEEDEDSEEDKDNEGEGLEEAAEGEKVSEEYVKLPTLFEKMMDNDEEDNHSEK